MLFLWIIGIPLVLSLLLPIIIIAGKGTDLAGISIMVVTILGSLSSLIILLNWFYAIGSRLQPYLPYEARANVSLLKIFRLVPIIYIAVLAIWMILIVSRLQGDNTFSIDGAAFMAIFVFLLHLFSMFCIFYCMYHAAKTLKAAELQRKVTFSDFAGEFFLMWFFPVGVWILQPRINKIVAEEPESNDMDIFSANPI